MFGSRVFAAAGCNPSDDTARPPRFSPRHLLRGARHLLLTILACWLIGAPAMLQAQEQRLQFLSTQFAPLNEATLFRRQILLPFHGRVNFEPYDSLAIVERLTGDDHVAVDLIAGVHGDMVALDQVDLIRAVPPDLGTIADREIPPAIAAAARLGHDRARYIPWVQTTYLMAARREALAHLPVSADINALTYEELIAWSAALYLREGRPLLGFPAGPRGLMPRFIQGFLYPSYTGGSVTTLRGPEADRMWRDMRALWRHVNRRSLTYNQMHEPLLSGDVWVAWDHAVRLLPAILEAPDDFVVFPTPIGPRGRGVMVVVIGLGLPMSADCCDGADEAALSAPVAELITHLVSPETEAEMISALGVFPIEATSRQWPIDPLLIDVADAVAIQISDPETIIGVLPPALGGGASALTMSYMLAFTQIVLRDADPEGVLAASAEQINSVLDAAPQACWLPDPETVAPCRVP